MKKKKRERKRKAVKKNFQKRVSKQSNSKKIERILTGIPNFDSLIEGGFKKNSTNIIVGSSGSGKTIFSAQFLIAGLKKNEKCLYITFEEKKEQFYKDMARFGWDLESFEKKGLFIFLEYTPAKVKTMLEEGGGEIENVLVKEKISRVVIDSITSFALLFENELEKREAALELFNMIKNWNCTSLVTLEEDPSKKDDTGHSIEFESDSIILFYFVRNANRRSRYLEILKMRGTNHSKEVHEFEIGKKGLSVTKKASKNPPIPQR